MPGPRLPATSAGLGAGREAIAVVIVRGMISRRAVYSHISAIRIHNQSKHRRVETIYRQGVFSTGAMQYRYGCMHVVAVQSMS